MAKTRIKKKCIQLTSTVIQFCTEHSIDQQKIHEHKNKKYLKRISKQHFLSAKQT